MNLKPFMYTVETYRVRGGELKKWRLAGGWTMAEFGKLAGVSAGFLCDVEHNRRQPGKDAIDRICAVFDEHGGKEGLEAHARARRLAKSAKAPRGKP